MVDIETYGVSRFATILSIGICRFDIDGISNPLYMELDLRSQAELRSTDDATVDWWKQRAIPAPINGTMPIKEALAKLGKHMTMMHPGRPVVWCKGTNFDSAILAHAYTQYGLPIPWKYNDVRDARTIIKTFPWITLAVNPKEHHALYDAEYQAIQVIQCFRWLELIRARKSLSVA